MHPTHRSHPRAPRSKCQQMGRAAPYPAAAHSCSFVFLLVYFSIACPTRAAPLETQNCCGGPLLLGPPVTPTTKSTPLPPPLLLLPLPLTPPSDFYLQERSIHPPLLCRAHNPTRSIPSYMCNPKSTESITYPSIHPSIHPSGAPPTHCTSPNSSRLSRRPPGPPLLVPPLRPPARRPRRP